MEIHTAGPNEVEGIDGTPGIGGMTTQALATTSSVCGFYSGNVPVSSSIPTRETLLMDVRPCKRVKHARLPFDPICTILWELRNYSMLAMGSRDELRRILGKIKGKGGFTDGVDVTVPCSLRAMQEVA